MRLFVSFVAASCALGGSSALAMDVVAHNAPAPPVQQGPNLVQDGVFSDALSSNGEYWHGLGLAQGFTTTSGYTLDRLTVWGASQYIGVTDPWSMSMLSSNILGFQIVLLSQNLSGAYVAQHSWNININNVTQSATGTYASDTLSPVFALTMDLTGEYFAAAGTYYLAVGAVLANGDGDAWEWIGGVWDGTDSAHHYIATTADTPTSWGQWSPTTTGISGAMLLESNIPGPGGLVILTAGLCGGSRRRRR